MKINPLLASLVIVIALISISLIRNTSESKRDTPTADRLSTTNRKKADKIIFSENKNQLDTNINVIQQLEPDLSNLELIINQAIAINDAERRLQSLKQIAHLWALQDPDASFKWSLTLDDNILGKDYVAAQIVSTLVNIHDLDKVKKFIGSMTQGKAKDTVIGYSISDVMDQDIATAVEFMMLIASSDSMKSIAEHIASEIVDSDQIYPMKDMLDGMPSGSMKEYLETSFIRNLAIKNPNQALDWLRVNQKQITDETLGSLAYGFALAAPLKGIVAASEIYDKDLRKNFLSYLTSRWGSENPLEAGEWLISAIQSSDFDSNKIEFGEIAKQSLAKNPSLIFDQILKIKNPIHRSEAFMSAAGALSEYNPSKAAELVLSVSNNQPENRDSELQRVARNWLERDPLAASQWINTISSGNTKDLLISELVSNILEKDKDTALARSWAEQIGNSDIKSTINIKIGNITP
ncbi:MAG: hypothetical protein EAZ42_04320 [Verrucomicrobia bacterium]|nr:MAG: hypothetical protein EAZ42_04320 [Verrucomicrobiota bacterium]